MYTTHFLHGERALGDDARHLIENIVSKAHTNIGEDLDLAVCEVFVAARSGKIPEGGMLTAFSYDHAGVYLFVNADLIEQSITSGTDRESVEKILFEHLYRSLYATARTRHLNLGADCGLLEEAVGEGLSEIFVSEKTTNPPNKRYVQFSDGDIRRLWEKMVSELDSNRLNVEKWFSGDTNEGIAPFAACSVGFAVAGAYLESTGRRSVDALAVPARDIVVLQNRY